MMGSAIPGVRWSCLWSPCQRELGSTLCVYWHKAATDMQLLTYALNASYTAG